MSSAAVGAALACVRSEGSSNITRSGLAIRQRATASAQPAAGQRAGPPCVSLSRRRGKSSGYALHVFGLAGAGAWQKGRPSPGFAHGSRSENLAALSHPPTHADCETTVAVETVVMSRARGRTPRARPAFNMPAIARMRRRLCRAVKPTMATDFAFGHIERDARQRPARRHSRDRWASTLQHQCVAFMPR